MHPDLDYHLLFSLASPEHLSAPSVPTVFFESSLDFLSQIHRRQSEALKAIIAESGWPHSGDEHADAAAFIVALHADYDVEFQKLCHSLMLSEAMAGKTKPAYLAFLTDRILCNMGKHQRFGTQIREVANGSFVPKPMEDSDNIDDLRKKVGLMETLADYFQRVNDGDMMLYRTILNGYGEELETRKEQKIIPFPNARKDQ